MHNDVTKSLNNWSDRFTGHRQGMNRFRRGRQRICRPRDRLRERRRGSLARPKERNGTPDPRKRDGSKVIASEVSRNHDCRIRLLPIPHIVAATILQFPSHPCILIGYSGENMALRSSLAQQATDRTVLPPLIAHDRAFSDLQGSTMNRLRIWSYPVNGHSCSCRWRQCTPVIRRSGDMGSDREDVILRHTRSETLSDVHDIV